ncbi:MAG: FAD-dependent oxidoreductase [Phycisphaerae bacterium]|nr:FAD-dependent oxidoreductase [Phycisphaerae bacterium]
MALSTIRVATAAASCLGCLASFTSLAMAASPVVNESPRQLPVVYEADVAVVGGSTGAVAAAVSAAESGAKVFLAAPRTYLGEDMCAALRLWLEPGETPQTPLEKDLYRDPVRTRGLPFKYKADLPSMDKHKDTDPPNLLTDGRWGNAFTESVQYNGDVTITIDLGEPKALDEARIMYFQSDRRFEMESVTVLTGDDGKTWTQRAPIRNPKLAQGEWAKSPLTLTMPIAARARYVRFHITKGKSADRMLLGEIQIISREREGKGPGNAPLPIPPMQIKHVLEKALRDAGVEFLYGCYATSVLTDPSGAPAGLEIVNRAGRQAVLAKVVIDATDRAWLARAAGARFRPYPSGPQTFRRIVAGGDARVGDNLSHTVLELARPLGGHPPVRFGSSNKIQAINAPMSTEFPKLFTYALRIPMRNGSFASFAEAEQVARDRTYHPKGLLRSETIWQVPPDAMHGKTSAAGPWPGAEAAELDAFRPPDIERLYVLGGCADVTREAAKSLARPLELMRVGVRIGKAAAKQAAQTDAPGTPKLAGTPGRAPAKGDTREPSRGLRPTDTPARWVQADARAIPVFGQYDVVVAGGGTSGAPAAIAAARRGARTLVLEYLTDLGGVGTTGLIGYYCAGYRKGFTAEVDAGIAKLGSPCYVEGKMEWWRSEIRKAGGTIWFGVLACGALVDDGQVKGVVVATPEGRGVVLAKTVIDATGNGDVAIAAGAKSMYVGPETAAMQGTGLPQWEIGASYINTDWTYVDETDLIDLRSALVVAKRRYPGAWDLGQLVDTRERRRMLGEYVMSPLDVINQRTFPDTVGISQGGRLDKHGFTTHPCYLINNHLGGIAYTPYRCLLPKGLEGILVVGLAVSAHHDAIPSIRMQPCMQNLGYAAGCAATMAATLGGKTRSVDIRKLQKHLVSIECLTPEVLTHQDSFPLPDKAVHDAVRRLVETDYKGLGVLMAAWDRAAALLRQAHDSAPTPEGKLRCAHVLGVMGDAGGYDTLADVVSKAKSYAGQNIDTYFPGVTWLDSYIIALGRTRDRRATPLILAKLEMLGSGEGGNRFSHYRAVCEALEQLADPAAAEPLAGLLKRCGGADDVVAKLSKVDGSERGRGGERNLIIARVLYRCGDWEGLGQSVLTAYVSDLRGVYARHAKAVLQRKPGQPTRPDGWIGL